MATNTGTLDLKSLLSVRFQSPVQYGLDTLLKVIGDDLAAHNLIMLDQVGELCEVSTDRQRRYGTSSDSDMQKVDEYGRGTAQKVKGGSTVGFPLDLFTYPLSWTQKWMETHTVADMAEQVQAAEKAHRRRVVKEIKLALYNSVNVDFEDYLVDFVSLGVKRLANADGAGIPDGPNGEKFDGATHTHYLAINGITPTAVTNAVNTITEHGHTGNVRLAIAKADETAVRNLAGFVPFTDERLIAGVSADHAADAVSRANVGHRAIGIFGDAVVWVKPWALAGYPLAYDAGATEKPLVFRQRDNESLQGLRIAAELADYPLFARVMEAEFGIGAWGRTSAAVLYTGGAAYVVPTIA
ncbi:MAG TPA: hypothetical protein PLC98_15815 [Anaerolineales bacterium]|nr:hypothetical protein [Anaerolineales bacterium]